MKRIIMILAMCLTVPTGLYAQKVYAKDGKAILDMTVEAGMPAGAVTSTPKGFVNSTPSASTYLNGSTNDNSISTSNNEKVYQKLEVALWDMNNAGTIGTTGTFTMNWVTAFKGCKGAAGGAGWRLPTQRELMMMWIFSDAFKSVFAGLGGTAFNNSSTYWSATEYSATYSWNVNFSDGYTTDTNKTYISRVRCVREL